MASAQRGRRRAAAWLTQCALVALLVASVSAEESVRVCNEYDQLVTSSTLSWVAAHRGVRVAHAVQVGSLLPPGSVGEESGDGAEGEEENSETQKSLPVHVCRARHHGVWVSGALRPDTGRCHVALQGVAERYEQYQVLQNVGGGARLSWRPWDKFPLNTKGAVACADNKVYVARRKVALDDVAGTAAGVSHYAGRFDTNDGFGRVFVLTEDDEEKVFTDGEVLVETEPVRYELSSVEFNKWRKRLTRRRTVLATALLRNGAGTEPFEVDSMLQYEANYSLYWGQAPATIKGLPTDVRLANGSIFDRHIAWGLEASETQRNVFKVSHFLEPGTAVNVTLIGNNTETELFYTGKLIAFYPDGIAIPRKINGSRREVDMKDVTAEYGPVYFIRNHSLVPTTTTTTTTTTSTTSTTTTTTTTTPAPPLDPPKPKKVSDSHDASVNEIKKGDGGMFADQASLSFKTEDGAKTERGAVEGGGGSGAAGSSVATPWASAAAAVVLAAVARAAVGPTRIGVMA